VLPDSSKITLSYGSTVEYNNDYGVTNRDMKFSGQALFEVAKNKKLPLRILTSDLNIEVKGTTFDVSAYQNDEEVTVKLFSGNIELFVHGISTRHNLKAGRMLVFDRKNKIFAPESTLSEKSLMWRSGIFIFDNNSMSEVLKKLERKYNLQIIVTDNGILNSAFIATIKNEDFRDIFKQIEFACNVKCDIKLTPDSSTQATIYIRSR
jgi:ferric-dicitrate binding protein FerR (iron transport regulator)